MSKQSAKKATKKTSSKPNVAGSVLINFVLDKSGSMATCLRDTIGGFNTYINELKKDTASKYSFSLTLFDTHFENRYVSVDLSAIPELTTSTYVPNGGTALFDAIGSTVSKVEQSFAGLPSLGPMPKILTVILTDGEENSSREYTLKKVKELIESKEKEGNWTFVFLGADLSAFKAGDAMGIRTANSVVYNQANMAATFTNTAAATMAFADSNLRSTDDLYKSVECSVSYKNSGMSRRTK